MLRLLFAVTVLVFGVGIAFAQPLEGTRDLKLIDADGSKRVIATISFSPDGKGARYSINWNDQSFEEHFLSMRPFKCLEGPRKHWCRVPYPYEINRKITVSDLTDLEYDTLFIWKGATEYGINMWNGVYYKMEIEDGKITGSIHEMDMDLLGVPPEDGNLRPISQSDIEPGEPESHWLPFLVIE